MIGMLLGVGLLLLRLLLLGCEHGLVMHHAIGHLSNTILRHPSRVALLHRRSPLLLLKRLLLLREIHVVPTRIENELKALACNKFAK